MSKEALIIILDVGQTMGRLRGDGQTSGLDRAKTAFRLIVEQKLLFGYKQDQIGVVLFNTKDTNNSLYDQYGAGGEDEGSDGDYAHISTFWEMQKPSIGLLESIDDISIDAPNSNKKKKGRNANQNNDDSGYNADILDALLVGAQMIHDCCGTKKYQKRIFMLTDATSKLNEQDQTDDIAASFNDQNIEFYCLGIGFGDEKEPDSDDENEQDIDVSNDDIIIEGGDPNRPPNSIGNEKRLRSFVKKIPKGTVYNAKEAIQMLSSLRTKSVLNRATYTDTFEITKGLKINVQLYTRCREQTLPSLKKQSLKSNEEGPASQGVAMERVYKNKFNKNGNNNSNIKEEDSGNNADIFADDGLDDLLDDLGNDGSNNNNNNDNNNNNNNGNDNESGDLDDDIVDEESRIKSYLYGKQRIPFAESDLRRLEYKSGPKHFQLIGFISKSQIKRYQFMGPSLLCVANQKTNASDQSNELALSAFIHGCHEKNVCGLARLVSRKNAAPKFVCLIPRIKASHECFIVNELPFYEDIRHFPFAGFQQNKKFIPNRQQLECMENLVNTLDLMKPGSSDEADGKDAEIDDDEVEEALKPQNTFNPILQRFYDNLQARAIANDCELQELNPLISKYLEPPSDLFEKAEPIFSKMSELFPTKLIAKKDVKNQRAHWNALENDLLDGLFESSTMDSSNVADSEMGNNNNNNNNDNNELEDDDLNLENMLDVNEVTKIGTQDPISDFDTLLKKRSSPDLFKKLSKELIEIIFNLVDTSYQSLNFDKAIDCIAHLRKQSILEEEPLLFNDHLRNVKIKYETKKKSFWKKLVTYSKDNIKLTLLCNDDFEDEMDGLNVTKQDANSFLEKKEEVKQKVEATNLEESDDDLDDLI